MAHVTVFPIEPVEAGKGGKGGVPRDIALTGHNSQITNADFVAAVFPLLPEGAFAAICSKSGDPGMGGWSASRADLVAVNLSAENNNYIGCASFYPGDDGSFKARKTGFAACHFLMLDDLGTKVPLERLAGFELSWLIETSPGNHQGGIIFADPLTDTAVAVRLLGALIDSGLCDAGATGPLSRWARLPVAINGKPKYADEEGVPFQCRLIEWRPDKRYTPQEIVDRLQLELAPAGRPKKTAKTSAASGDASRSKANDADDVLTPKAAENPVVTALKARGLYKTPLGSGKHDMTCPWVHEHTDGLDTGAAYFEPDEFYTLGGFCCQHSHRDKYRIRALLEYLGVRNAEARHKPVIRVVRQPYFRESDGELITQAGYDKEAQRFGVFDARRFVIPDPTLTSARAALALLEDLLAEFHFVAATDKAAALAAIFTAVVRPSLPYAPGFHARAPVFGSGKTYLCELIGAFAGPAGNAKVSYPTTSEEATKVILSLLLTSPAVIEFDDMDTDWIPHGTIKRMLTAEQITDRILGVSKTATVSTRTLFLGSGNNVGPIRDLLRRVLTIHIDPRCATPATMTYRSFPVDKVRQNRGKYVAAVLTIILAWRKAGMPRAVADSIVTFSGAWSDYCRYPLMWLGQPDPATALLEQVRHDPDGDALMGLMTEWRAVFGSTATTVRKAVETAMHHQPNLLDALRELPVEEHGEINRSKLGWLLKKNANRIVDGFEFQQAEADGRTAWRVVAVKSPPPPPLTPSPPFTPPVEKTVSGTKKVGSRLEKQTGRGGQLSLFGGGQ